MSLRFEEAKQGSKSKQPSNLPTNRVAKDLSHHATTWLPGSIRESRSPPRSSDHYPGIDISKCFDRTAMGSLKLFVN